MHRGDVENFQLISSDTQVAMTAQGNGNDGPNFDEEQGGGSTDLQLDSGVNDNDRGQVTFSVAKTGGDTVSGNLGYDDPNIFNGENVCAVYGHIILQRMTSARVNAAAASAAANSIIVASTSRASAAAAVESADLIARRRTT